ncbi:MAG: RIP metalloprotease RseP [Cyanobacteria bacterium J083]|nr:MAG: RIP metalloprotease RseP [Cyanobacteria bacterium J083]
MSVLTTNIGGAIAAISVLLLLIFVHELGHFLAAKLQGIRVNRFSIGFGPAIFSYQGKDTEYAFRLIPLGGYVGFPDDDPDTDIPADDPNLLRNRPILDRAIVISAGVIANLVFAYFLLVGQSLTVGFQEMNYQPGVAVPQIIAESDSAAFKAGMKAKDIILAVDQLDLEASPESMTILREKIQNSPEKPLELKVKRGEEILSLQVTPQRGEDGKGKIGVILAPNGEIIKYKADNIITGLTAGAKQFENVMNLTLQGFWQLISNFSENAGQVAGPVRIVEVGTNLAKSNAGNLLQFGALISINLAIINILPLPALDGGQLAFLAIEGLLGRPLPTKWQESIMQTGLVLLFSLGFIVIVRDTLNLSVIQELLH